MDLSKLNLWELFKLECNLQIELLKRTWWLVLIIFIVYIILSWKYRWDKT